MGLFAPAGTPRAVVDRLNSEVVRILALPDVKSTYANAGLTATSNSPVAFSAHVIREYHKWAKVVAESGIVAD